MKIVYKDEAVKAFIRQAGQLDDLTDACLEAAEEDGIETFEVTYDDDVAEWYINY